MCCGCYLLSLQGEMSRMVMQFPQAHVDARNYVKYLVCRNGKASPSNVRVGLSINSNKMCGRYCTQADIDSFDHSAIQTMFKAMDFVGKYCMR